MSINTLSEVQERELHRLSRFYFREAKRCEESRAYLAGCVLVGSALEALLMLMVNVFPDEAEATGVAPIRNGRCMQLLDWNLAQLLSVARAADWLPSGLDVNDTWNTRKAKIGDYAEVSRMVRNLIHPGRYVKEHSPSRVTAKYLQRQFEVVLLCRDWLVARNNRSLLEHMQQEGIA
jgi:hypothetical protein